MNSKIPFVHPKVLKKVQKERPKLVKVIKESLRKESITLQTWSRASTITPNMVRFIFGVHNRRDFTTFQVRDTMIGRKLGEFSPTRSKTDPRKKKKN